MPPRSRYGPTLVRGVSDIIQARMRAIGLRFQTQLAEALGIDKGNLGKQIAGERTIPLERIEEWQKALQLDGDLAEEFDLAVRLTHSDAKVRDLLARQDSSWPRRARRCCSTRSASSSSPASSRRSTECGCAGSRSLRGRRLRRRRR